MTVSVGNFALALARKIEATTDPQELVILTKAATKLKNGIVNTVNSVASLPTITTNIYGEIYLVSNDRQFYFAHPTLGWTLLGVIPYAQEIFGWGSNNCGTLGNGTIKLFPYVGYQTAQKVCGGNSWDVLSLGWCTAIAIKKDGTLWTWGNNTLGQLGNNSTIACGSPGTTVGGGTNWCAAAAGVHSLGIKTDGTLWTWGNNNYGQLGIDSSGAGTCRSSPGTVAGGGTTWCAVGSGTQFSSAIKNDGTLWTWGRNISGQLGTGTTTNRSSPGTVVGGITTWSALSVGGGFMHALRGDGTLFGWGANSQGQLGDYSSIERSSPVTITPFNTWSKLSQNSFGAEDSMSAIKTDGTLWTWGSATCGALGDGQTTVSRSSPGTTAGGGTNWCLTATGYRNAAGIKTDGTLWTWGRNLCSELGNGNNVSRSSPGTTTGNFTDWSCVRMTPFTTLAMRRTQL